MACKKNAFTLGELIIVVLILVLLIAFLFTALNKVRDGYGAESILCKTNLKGYGNAFMIYLDDNDQRFLGGPNTLRWARCRDYIGALKKIFWRFLHISESF
jgi:hypothetical protein